jgi:hypothetical protein
MKIRNQMKTTMSLAALALVTTSAQAATTALTDVDQLDLTSYVKAYDFTGSNSIASDGTSFDIGSVTFTRHAWNDGLAFDGMTMTGHHTADNQNSSHVNIGSGGDAADRANLNELLHVWNIGAGNSNGSQVDLSIALTNGTYNLQYLVGGGGSRGNDLFDVSNGAVGSGNEVLLGSFETTSSTNYLITGTVTVTDGSLELAVVGDNASGDARPILSGLIISQVPEPSTTALLGLGGLALILRRRK